MSIEIKRFRDEGKLLKDDLERIVKAYVENTTSRDVYSVEFHSDGRAGLGAATIKFKFEDE
jgi:hypothetical protein